MSTPTPEEVRAMLNRRAHREHLRELAAEVEAGKMSADMAVLKASWAGAIYRGKHGVMPPMTQSPDALEAEAKR